MIAHKNYGALTDLCGLEIARVRNLAFQTDIAPMRTVEESRQFLVIIRPIAVD
jgi:hypothetical protein